MRPPALIVSVLMALSVLAAVPAAASADPVGSVNPFIGTQNNPNASYPPFGKGYGNTFPGATTPFGMVQFSPDTYNTASGADNWGGYEYPANQIRGFSLTHLDGTGCEGSFGFHDLPFMPYTGSLNSNGSLPSSPATNAATYRSGFSHSTESASPGRYGVTLANGAKVELTATARTGMARFTFPAGKPATVLLNAGGSANGNSASSVSVSGNTVTGSARTTGTCGGGSYTVYFSARFDQAVSNFGTWNGGTVTARGASASGANTGTYLTFPAGSTVTVRVGLSYVRTANATANVAAENPSASFDTVAANASTVWAAKLGAVRTTGGSATQQSIFYTALYHALLHPNVFDDSNGEYLGMDGATHTVAAGHHQYANFSGWDVYRSEVQLITLLFPNVGSDMAQSLVNDASQAGSWYNWPYANVPVNIMNGDSLQSVVSSIYSFGGTGFDAAGALSSMVTTQSLPATRTIRGGLYEYAGTGYIPRGTGNVWGPAATTLEYAIDDFGIAQLAGRLGDSTNYAAFMQRAQNWQNLFSPATKSITPRYQNGQFATDYNLNTDNNDQYVEGTGTQYSWMVPQNIAALVAKMGGNAAVSSRLDTFFSQLNAGVVNGAYAWLTNEPTIGTPYLYDFVGAPSKTQALVRRVLSSLFTNAPNGLQGNDDLGELSASYVWGALGMYPSVTGRAELALASPIFTQAVITRDNGKVLTLNAPSTSDANQYVSALAVNGVGQSRTWLPESFVANGGTVDFTMTGAPTSWGAGAGDAPPSFSDGQNGFNNIGASNDGSATTANLDSSGHSYSTQALSAAGINPGGTVNANGMSFTWPSAAAGKPNNWLVNGQVIDLGGRSAARISFLGSASNGPATGTATVTYTDGSTSSVSITMTDWAVGTPQAGDTVAATLGHWNAADGSSLQTYLFATTPASLTAGKQVRSVTLPASTNQGAMHIFAVSAS